MSVICQAISTFIASATFGFVLNWNLSLLTLAFTPLIVAGTTISIRLIGSQLASDKKVTEEAAKIAIEVIGGIRTVASLHQEKYFLTKYTDVLQSKLKY
jgi:ABC-type bacteriocin/lantibiotic exporter with double-glycine peptidase domain